MADRAPTHGNRRHFTGRSSAGMGAFGPKQARIGVIERFASRGREHVHEACTYAGCRLTRGGDRSRPGETLDRRAAARPAARAARPPPPAPPPPPPAGGGGAPPPAAPPPPRHSPVPRPPSP